MKKRITTLFLLMLGASGAYAQVGLIEGPGVGIGNTLPAQSAMLDIAAKDKGVLIPRVELTKLTEFGMKGTAAESQGLLVYNTKVNATESLAEGFHYWSAGQWNLVVNDKTFREEITRIETKIGGGNAGEGGTVIYIPGKDGKPGEPGTPGEIKYVDKDGNIKEIIIKDLIQGAESNTFFRMQALKV
ncbi:MAG: hypothetical protein LBI72_05675, partial [Flavobacteriaceae bacterium]|nr:hypothetical protein [Flavobacteriaceae bacterium]